MKLRFSARSRVNPFGGVALGTASLDGRLQGDEGGEVLQEAGGLEQHAGAHDAGHQPLAEQKDRAGGGAGFGQAEPLVQGQPQQRADGGGKRGGHAEGAARQQAQPLVAVVRSSVRW